MPAPTAGAPRHDTSEIRTIVQLLQQAAKATSVKPSLARVIVLPSLSSQNHHAARDPLQRSMEHALARPFRTAPGRFRRFVFAAGPFRVMLHRTAAVG
jgi:hypothetical protein